MAKRTVFFLSDQTGITVEALGNSLLTQFDSIEFEQITLPFIDNEDKAREAAQQINQVEVDTGQRAIVFVTIVNPHALRHIASSRGCVMDFFGTFVTPLEAELQHHSSYKVGKTHSMSNSKNYNARIDAVNYALACDDGVGTKHYGQADLILLGVSRCGKTPTSLYLALQFGIYVANYPLTEEDIERQALPASLQSYRNKIFGLTIASERLHALRQERRPDSQYAALKQCRDEVAEIESLYRRENISFLNTTKRSIEEISTKILAQTGLKRHLY